MASGPITSWQTEGENAEAQIFLSWALKSPWTMITAMK